MVGDQRQSPMKYAAPCDESAGDECRSSVDCALVVLDERFCSEMN